MYVVGICSKNCEDTIAQVIQTVDEGLSKYFAEEPSLIIVSDLSEDRTQEVARGTETRAEKMVVAQEGGPGKGNGIRTILKEVQRRGASGVALIDGDLTSVKLDWIDKLLTPIKERYDEVIPFYIRHPYDGVITNQMAYPLTTVLYGKEIRQPIGGEFSLSKEAINKMLASPLFPEKFGIDIFLSTTGTVEGLKVVESVLGFKEHTSTREYEDPMKLLVPMYYQVVSSLFDMYLGYKDKVRQVTTISKVERRGEIPEGGTKSPSVDKEKWFNQIRQDYQEQIGSIDKIDFLASLKDELRPHLEKEKITLPLEAWAKCVFLALNNYAKDKQRTLDVLRVFWEARYMGLVQETENLGQEEAEQRIQDQVKVFWKYREMLEL